MWQEIKRKGKLLARIDTERALLEIVRRGEIEIVDLTKYGLAPARQCDIIKTVK